MCSNASTNWSWERSTSWPPWRGCPGGSLAGMLWRILSTYTRFQEGMWVRSAVAGGLGEPCHKPTSIPHGGSLLDDVRQSPRAVVRYAEGTHIDPSRLNQGLHKEIRRSRSSFWGQEHNATKEEVKKITPDCQGCSKKKSEFVCAGCSNRWYCSRECQVKRTSDPSVVVKINLFQVEDWDEHADECSG